MEKEPSVRRRNPGGERKRPVTTMKGQAPLKERERLVRVSASGGPEGKRLYAETDMATS